jgi:hypothetical protein
MPDVATKARDESPIKIGAKIRRTARDRVRQWGAPVEALAFYEAFLVDELPEGYFGSGGYDVYEGGD